MQHRSEDNHMGIDIASYQAGLNFAAVKAAGISIVYIKATEGLTYVNPYLKRHCQEAKAQGLRVSFYHYFWPNRSATQQAQHFINSIQGLEYDCMLALDVEELEGLGREPFNKSVSLAMQTLNSLTGHTPVIYCNTNYAKNYLSADYVGSYPVWIADYNTRGVPGSNPIWDVWAGYQYSSKGNIGGITVDMDEFTDAIFIYGGGENMDIDQALQVLMDKKVITDMTYWRYACNIVKYLDVLVVRVAQMLSEK